MTQDKFEKMLPDFLRDFHDQKDVFKAIEMLYSKPENPMPNNWIDNHVFTIDWFLCFMADHGYTLQKYRGKKIKTFDIHETLKEKKEKRSEVLGFLTKQ